MLADKAFDRAALSKGRKVAAPSCHSLQVKTGSSSQASRVEKRYRDDNVRPNQRACELTNATKTVFLEAYPNRDA